MIVDLQHIRAGSKPLKLQFRGFAALTAGVFGMAAKGTERQRLMYGFKVLVEWQTRRMQWRKTVSCLSKFGTRTFHTPSLCFQRWLAGKDRGDDIMSHFTFVAFAGSAPWRKCFCKPERFSKQRGRTNRS